MWPYLALAVLLAGSAAQAQDGRAAAAADPSAAGLPPVASMAAAPAGPATPTLPDDRIIEFERSLEFVYAEVEALRREREIGPAKLIAIGTGAGIGLVIGSVASGIVLVPAVAGMATAAGLSSGWAEALGATVRTITTVAFTLGGGSVGQALVD